MSSGNDHEPIEPGGGGKLARFLPELWPIAWLLLIYFGIAWWRGEPPSWRSVLNIVGIGAALLALAGWKSSPERRLEKRLRRLFRGGRIPDPAEVLAVLEGTGDTPFRAIADRYALGMLTPEAFVAEMAALLKLPAASMGA